MPTGVLIAFCTFPDARTAEAVVTQLVDKSLVACGNILPQVRSFYRWQGKMEKAEEVLAVFKLTAAGYAEFEATLKPLHPYDVPEIIAWPIERGFPDYLQWVKESCSKQSTNLSL
jgi:periplasmic divalent cation tolerance protein